MSQIPFYWRARLTYPEASAEEAEAFVELTRERYRESYGRGALIGALAAAIIAGLAAVGWPAPWARAAVVGGAGVAFVLALFGLTSRRIRLLGDHTEFASVGIGVAIGIAAGLAAAPTGGFRSLWGLVLLLVWLFDAAIAPMRPAAFAVALVAEGAAYVVPVAAVAGAGGLGLFSLLALGTAAICQVSTVLRDAAAARTFVARRRLEEALEAIAAETEELERQRAELAGRVDKQVAEALVRQAAVSKLQALLDAQSTARSESLARALARPALDSLGSAEALDKGSILAGRVRIERYLASGAFGDVYLADDLVSKDRVVVKVLRVGDHVSPDRVRRFVLEAAAAATVPHPAVVRVLHVDVTPEGVPFLLYEYVRGATLARVLALTPLPWAIAASIFAVAAQALAAAHGAGLVHRDVKPENLMLTTDEPGVKILDFGISRWLAGHIEITRAGDLVGTLAYMAPEQLDGSMKPGPEADVYSLGMTLYQCVVGQHPFHGLRTPELLKAHRDFMIPELGRAAEGTDLALSALVAEMLAKQAASRPSMHAVASRLAAIAERAGAPRARDVLALHVGSDGLPVVARPEEPFGSTLPSRR